MWPMLRLSLEFLLLFLVALWDRKFPGLPVRKGAYPNPLWLPVLVLSLQYGLGRRNNRRVVGLCAPVYHLCSRARG